MPQEPKGESFGALFEAEQTRVQRAGSVAVGAELDVVVAEVGTTTVFVDIDAKQQGFIDAADLRAEDGTPLVQPGARIRARVVELGGRSGAPRLVPLLVRAAAGQEVADGGAVATQAADGTTVVVGARVKGTVAGVERYGVFVQIGDASKRGPRGLVPAGELGVPRGADLHKMFPAGSPIEAVVVAIDERGRIRLSVSRLAADDERREYVAFEEAAKRPAGAAKGMGTLGDLLGSRLPAPAPAAAPARAAPGPSPPGGAPRRRKP